MKYSEAEITDILQTINHPAKGKNIVELGMIRNLRIEGKKIEFQLHFSQVNDPMKSSIKNACTQALESKLRGSPKIIINFSNDIKPVNIPEPIIPEVSNIIAIASGKGGVGKSTIAVNLAIAFANAGAKVGLIDADVFGPSVPKMLNAEHEKPFIEKINGKDKIIPVERYNIKVLSIGFFVDPADATIWRGPMASNAFKQLMSDTNWGYLDYLFIDLPPGTSDIHLTLVQTVAVTGAVIVSTPQAVALADVIKGINMFRNNKINVPVFGIVENMAWFTPEELPENRYYIFGKDGCKKLADEMNVPLLGQIPIVQSIREGGDEGTPAVVMKDKISDAFKMVAENLEIQVKKRNAEQNPTKRVEIKKK